MPNPEQELENWEWPFHGRYSDSDEYLVVPRVGCSECDNSMEDGDQVYALFVYLEDLLGAGTKWHFVESRCPDHVPSVPIIEETDNDQYVIEATLEEKSVKPPMRTEAPVLFFTDISVVDSTE